MRDEIKPIQEIDEEDKKAIEKREAIREKVAEAECPVCDGNLMENGISPEPGVCHYCYVKMVGGKKLKDEE